MAGPETIVTPPQGTKLVTFHRLIPNARLPRRADRSAAGMLPTRAFRYCEPSSTASGFGYYIFPAMDFSLLFDGYDVLWTYPGAGDWEPIPKLGGVQYPGFRDYFASVAPPECAEYAPPLMAVLQEPGHRVCLPNERAAVRKPYRGSLGGRSSRWNVALSSRRWRLLVGGYSD